MSVDHLFQLKDKVAIITGASKGIGEATARCFVEAGALVVINSRKEEEIITLARDISSDRCIGISGNMGELNDCKKLIQAATEKWGGVDVLVNNAAINPVYGPLLESDGNAFDKIIKVNVKGPFELSNLVHPIMKQRGGGAIINISSIEGLSPDDGMSLYAISKAALNMLTKAQAKEWGIDGIRVNAICPGIIKTKFSRVLWENEDIFKKITKNIAIPRAGTPAEIASLALYLACDASSYTTGAILVADGGTTL